MIYIGNVKMAELDGETVYFAVAADSYAEAVQKIQKESGPILEVNLKEVADSNIVWLPDETTCEKVEHERKGFERRIGF